MGWLGGWCFARYLELMCLHGRVKVVLVFTGSPNTASPLRSMLDSFKNENSGKKDEWKFG